MTGTLTKAIDPDQRAALAHCLTQIANQRCRDSFKTIFQFYAPRIKSYLMRIGATETEAEENTQEVMTTIWRKAQLFDASKASPSTWIFRIARNKSIDAHRRRPRNELDPNEPMLRPADIEEPDAELDRAQTGAKVREALSDLPPEQADLLHQSFYEGLTHSEIAKRNNLPLGTVKSRIRLAFQRMRKSLSG